MRSFGKNDAPRFCRKARAMNADVVGAAPAPYTTVILQNLPDKITSEDLVRHLYEAQFEDRFDFVHVPFDTTTKANLGYGIVNLVRANDVPLLRVAFEGRVLEAFDSSDDGAEDEEEEAVEGDPSAQVAASSVVQPPAPRPPAPVVILRAETQGREALVAQASQTPIEDSRHRPMVF
eukprot:TRINITY_DN5850_c0_g1_i5.p1 TRINITY_DN5850_c0_g1~~TRINITY_DN5850_c0_g1_i5.p1  ORF type:complete len:177 (+),score=47.06 TRINITY_DN5850_c0_g1_i5:341-871(+)